MLQEIFAQSRANYQLFLVEHIHTVS
jgi:hypothetical protein